MHVMLKMSDPPPPFTTITITTIIEPMTRAQDRLDPPQPICIVYSADLGRIQAI